MKDFLESLSLGTGAILAAILSAGLVWLLSSVCPAALRKVWLLLIPFLVACCLYWSPVWLGADQSEYHVWVFLGVGAWFVAGLIPSAVIVLMLEKVPRKLTF
jgi:hypothetical protein